MSAGDLGPGPAAEPDPMIGQVLDNRYRIVSKLGEGGMGEVYAAEHIHIGKPVAIKLLRAEIVSNEEAVGRFQQEARSAYQVGSEFIIRVEDFGSLPDGRKYMAMELLDGQPLNDMLVAPIEPERLIEILMKCCHGLAAAHKKGIIHRDMKPENIFVTTGDVPKLLDFGIAKVSQGEGENHLTRTGTIFGTPFYMAPEQALGQAVDHRADIYAMGVIMYECFCGSVPFQGESFMGILTQHITAEPKPPQVMAQEHGRVLPSGLAEVIARCMAKDPNQRFQSMDELVEALVRVYRGISGAGMSAYLEAHVPPPSTAMSAVMPSLGMAGTGLHGHPSAAVVSPAASEVALPISAPRKSRTGLVVAVVVLLIAGGAGGYLYWSQQHGSGAGSSDTAASGDGAAGDSAAGDSHGAVPTEVEADAAAKVTAVIVDAGVPVAAIDAAVQVEPVYVLLNSTPGMADVYRDGDKLTERTPTNIKVVPGQPIELVLKRRGYEDETVTLTGEQTKVNVSLARIPVHRPSNDNTSGKNGNGKNGNGKNGNGKNGNGKNGAEPKRCSAEWCKIPANKSTMCCQLE